MRKKNRALSRFRKKAQTGHKPHHAQRKHDLVDHRALALDVFNKKKLQFVESYQKWHQQVAKISHLEAP